MSSFSNNQPSHYNSLTVSGKGQITAVPDTAIVRLGVQTTGEALKDIQEENAKISENVLNALRQYGITDIKTHLYSIDKLINYVNGVQVDQGYSVRNIFEIRFDEMDLAGEIIDAAVSSGANVVEFINFEVSDASDYYLKALNLAVSDAYQKAKSILMHIGVHLEPIPKNITENSGTPIPYSQVRLERSFATPIEPGVTQIEASVTIEFIY
jgi:uncharacterized protein YggE